ncbi:hypothetical protein FIBSPDRAFT_868897, partial [Athelia psychrophila]
MPAFNWYCYVSATCHDAQAVLLTMTTADRVQRLLRQCGSTNVQRIKISCNHCLQPSTCLSISICHLRQACVKCLNLITATSACARYVCSPWVPRLPVPNAATVWASIRETSRAAVQL